MSQHLDRLRPPKAKKKPEKVVIHGDMLSDDYHWIRDRSDPDTMAYIEAENVYTGKAFRSMEDLQKELYDELLRRTAEEDSEPPVTIDGFQYYRRTTKGKPYSIYCRRKGTEGEEEIVLDENAVAEGHEFFCVESIKISPSQNLVAYSFDTSGDEYYDVGFIDTRTQKPFPDKVTRTGGFEWGSSDRIVYYIVHDDAHRPYRIMRHVLGTELETDEIVYEEMDPACEYMSLKKSKSKEFLFVTAQTLTTGEVNFLRADDDTGRFKPVVRRKRGVRYYVLHEKGDFHILTNDGAPNFRIVQAPASTSSSDDWTEVFPHRDSVIINVSDPYPWVDVFADYIAIFEREDAISSVRILDRKTGESHLIELPEKLRFVTPMENPQADSTTLRFAYTSMLTPKRVYEYDMTNRTLRLVKEDDVPGYDSSDFHVERIHVTVADGTKVPVNIVHKKGIIKDRRNPLLLYAYGAAGDFEGSAPVFDIGMLSLLERGFVYAVAGIRGGGEYGQSWYDNGRMLNKKNCFTDFIECAEQLVAEGYTSSEMLAINGASAGGLLVASAMTMRPDLFKVVVAEVPFVDVVFTMADKSIPLVIGEYEEYGDMAFREVYEYCKSYSPYENVEAVKYPDMLVTSGMNDPRVPFWEPIKWVARLRDRGVGDSMILLRTNMTQGHHGASARYDAIEYNAFRLAFIIDRLQRR
ncbi:MAG: S9 family peptidase [Thermoplasmata archaeon]|nr:S9 family peptidase [Thermoplasmata archaeon]